MLEKEFEKPANMMGYVITIGLIIFGVVGYLGSVLPDYITKSGAIGDWISGTIGVFISYGAFFLLYYTYKAQKEELKATKKQMNIQNSMLALQQFETTFFNLINLFKDNAKRLGLVLPEVEKEVNSEITLLSMYPSIPPDWNRVINKYIEIKSLPKYRSVIDSYFKNLEYILGFIDGNNTLTDDSKKVYFQLIEANMNEDELFITFFECRARGLNNLLTREIKRANLLLNFLLYHKHSIPTQLRDSF